MLDLILYRNITIKTIINKYKYCLIYLINKFYKIELNLISILKVYENVIDD